MQVTETLNEGLKRGYSITVKATELDDKVNEKLVEAQPEHAAQDQQDQTVKIKESNIADLTIDANNLIFLDDQPLRINSPARKSSAAFSSRWRAWRRSRTPAIDTTWAGRSVAVASTYTTAIAVATTVSDDASPRTTSTWPSTRAARYSGRRARQRTRWSAARPKVPSVTTASRAVRWRSSRSGRSVTRTSA